MPRTKAFNENEVLNKAMELFWRKGFHATSMQDIVEALGINRASLYNTYGDKMQLFRSSVDQYQSGNYNRLETVLNGQENVQLAFRQLFEGALEQACNDPEQKGCFIVNITTEFVPGPPEISEILQQNRKAVTRIFHKRLQRGQQEGQLSEAMDTNALASFLITQYYGLMAISKTSMDRDEMQQVLNIALGSLAK